MEEEKVTPMWKLKREIHKQKAKNLLSDTWNGVKKAGKGAAAFTMNHPAEVLAGASSVGFIVKKLAGIHKTNVETKRRLCDYYDPRRGKYVHLYKPLTRKQNIEVDRKLREDPKATYVSVFDEMGIRFH